MARKKSMVDVRNVPSYGISETAHYLGLAEATLRSWIYGRRYPTRSGTMKRTKPVIYPPDRRSDSLSFYNLVEIHVLMSARNIYGLGTPAVRNAVNYVREQLGVDRPLIQQSFYTDGKDLFIREIEKSVTIAASRNGQLAISTIVDLYLQRIEWDESGFAKRLFPLRAMSPTNDRVIVIDPHISFGRPVISGTGITAAVLWNRNRLGETEEELAKDYSLGLIAIREAISYYKAA